MYETPLTGLVLTGGGARAAYQVGVLDAIARLRREDELPLSRLAIPLDFFLGAKPVSLQHADADADAAAAQAAAAPASPPLRR